MSHFDDIREEDKNKRAEAEKKAYPSAKIPDRRGRVHCYGNVIDGYEATFIETPDRRRKSNDRRRRSRRGHE